MCSTTDAWRQPMAATPRIGLFVVRSRRNDISNRKENVLRSIFGLTPVRGGSQRIRLINTDQKGTRYGN